MEFFGDDDMVDRLQAQPPSAHPDRALGVILALAWQLRQRDSGRALALADRAQALLLADEAKAEPEKRAVLARLMLVRGEAKWLFAELDAAQTLADGALREFAFLGDPDGCADAHWLLAMVAGERGDGARREAELEAAAAKGCDPVRIGMASAALALYAAFRDPAAAWQRWGVRFADGKTGLHPAAGCWAEDFLATSSGHSADFAEAIRHFIEAHALALASGQTRRAIIAATNTGDCLNSLNEYQAALDWMERGLDLARRNGWPATLGGALIQTAQTLRHLQRHHAAREMLREALTLMAPLAASRNYAVGLWNMGAVELDCGDYPGALIKFQLLGERADALGQRDLQTIARRGQAEALFRLGLPHPALAAASAALALGKARPAEQIATLRVMADIHGGHALPPPPDMTAASAPLHYLLQALDLAVDITEYIVPGDLLNAIASAFAAIGDYRQAYEFACQAQSARASTHSQEATNRAIALHVTYETERERAESRHNRQLATSEARRAQALQQNSDTLERLSVIGQEITAHLDANLVFETLDRHVHHLLDASHFSIYESDADGLAIHRSFGVEDGNALPPLRIALSDFDANSIRCLRERCEILLDYEPGLEDPNLIPDTLPTLSALFAPLCLAGKALGVMTVQALRRHAYGAREQLVFRTLCAYAAIALANCQTHLRLKETQQQLILQEKMAALGTLTAGVAHEINNPTNFAHVGAQNLRADIAEFQHFSSELIEAEKAPEVLAAFNRRFTKLSAHAASILNGTERIAGIVRDLRAFTRLDDSKKQAVRLADCLNSTLNLVRASWLEKVVFVTDFSVDPVYACWPALLNQVFMNLLVNACQAIQAAGLADGEQGRITVGMRLHDGNIEIGFGDTGVGMTAQVQARALEPFFTTKGVGEGTGLGLSISYGIVQKHGGDLQIESVPGHGSCFTLLLPLAP